MATTLRTFDRRACILALLLPTVLGARSRAQNSAAKATVRTALAAGRVLFSNDQTGYLNVTQLRLIEVESSVDWVGAAMVSTEPTTVSWDNTGGVLTLAAFSKAGNCFFLEDDPPTDTQYATMQSVPTTDCRADNSGAETFTGSWYR